MGRGGAAESPRLRWALEDDQTRTPRTLTFSSTRSLMREMVSSASMSISISLPVSVLTLIYTR